MFKNYIKELIGTITVSSAIKFSRRKSGLGNPSKTSWPYFGVKLRKKTAYSYLKVT